MTVHGLQTKMAEVHRLAYGGIAYRLRGTGKDIARCIIGIWAEPDGTVVVHVNSGGNATAVVHALWRHYRTVDSIIHPDYGVLVWVE